ncbi:hypothetical protein M8845_02375 [Gelidibacter japonicus]|uniref:hypothetical protein n=1 Tax=Gelidibacter japonicus TaxID=1962232 RepID=UPI0020205525|nr:hypothetical protein [Gelidibacter japonicus]MCL8006262.1 hypothetical protein [Gelidibacter japonicus]
MNKYILLVVAGLLSTACNGQKNDTKHQEIVTSEKEWAEPPKGSWKVNREFDENGNLIRYDSTYSWSSNTKFNNLSESERDSLIRSFKSKFFKNYSVFENQGFGDVFSSDSLFIRHYFNDEFFRSDFGTDLIDIDNLRQQMIARQKKLLEKYQSEFLKPKDEN